MVYLAVARQLLPPLTSTTRHHPAKILVDGTPRHLVVHRRLSLHHRQHVATLVYNGARSQQRLEHAVDLPSWTCPLAEQAKLYFLF